MLPVSFLHRFIKAGQQLKPFRRDSRKHRPAVLRLTAPRNQTALLEAVEQARNVRIPGNHAAGDFAAGEPFGRASQDPQHVVLRRRELHRLEHGDHAAAEQVRSAKQVEVRNLFQSSRWPALLVLEIFSLLHTLIIYVATTIVKTYLFFVPLCLPKPNRTMLIRETVRSYLSHEPVGLFRVPYQIAIVCSTGKAEEIGDPLMSETGPATMESSAAVNERLLANMRQIDRRQWRLWTAAISVTLALAAGIASFALPALLEELDSLHAFFLNHEARGLLGLVLVFNIYIVYEQIQLNRLRHQFAEDLYTMAVLDPVTNMFNRRYIIHRLEEEISRCQRHGTPLTVIALDLNSFKQINDVHGHAVGDYVLRIFGDQMKRATRGSDVVARYGGDEFLAILPDCNTEQIQYVLSRLNGLHVKTGKSTTNIRYSAGWTDYIPGESLEDLLKRADDMLYANKRNPKGTFVSTVFAE